MHHIVYLRRNQDESEDMMHLRIESLCDTFEKDGASVVNISIGSAATEAWIVLRYPRDLESPA